MGVIATAERMACVEGRAAIHRELTREESLIAIAVAHLFAPTISALEERISALQDDLLVCRRCVGE